MKNASTSLLRLRVVAAAEVVLLLAVAVVQLAGPSDASAAQPPCALRAPLAVGVPSFRGQGAVDVHNGFEPGSLLVRPETDPAVPDGQEFGASVVLSDFDGRCWDLLVGAPGAPGGGAVYLVNGTEAGANNRTDIRLPFPSSAEIDRFGAALAVENVFFPGEPPSRVMQRIWVGAPGTDVAGKEDAGAVLYYTIGPDLDVSGPVILTQDSPGVPGSAEAGDRMGEVLAPIGNVRRIVSDYDSQPGALASGVAVGMPGEDVGGQVDAGMVALVSAPGGAALPVPHAMTENSKGVPGTAEQGDRFGASLDFDQYPGQAPPWLWIGVPDEDVGSQRDAGLVHALRVWPKSITSAAAVTQNSPFVPGRAEAGDHFGAAVLGTESCFRVGVAIGVPGEDIGNLSDAGTLHVYSAVEPDCDRPRKIAGGVAASNNTGAALGRYSRPDLDPSEDVLFWGSPGRDIGSALDAGVVDVESDFGKAVAMSVGSDTNQRYGSIIARFALNAY